MIDKQRNVIDFTLASLLRRKGKNAALVLVYTLLVALLASVMFLTQGLKEEAAGWLDEAPEIVVQRLMAGRYDLIPVAYAERIKAIPGVGAVTGRLWGYYYDGGIGANYTVMVPSENPVAPGTIAVGEGVARGRKIAQGDLVPLRGTDGETRMYEVAATLSSASALVSSDLLLMAEGDFRTLFSFPDGVVTDLVLTVRNPNERPTVARKIMEAFPDTRPVIREDIARTYDAMFSWRSGILIVILGTVVISFIIFAWDKASGLSAEEKYEIGILKALGWETADVICMKVWEGMVISFTSFLVGILLAYAHVFLASATLFAPVLKGWSVLYPDFRLTPQVNGFQVLSLFFMVVVPYTVATLFPAWRAATVDPDTVMRA